MYVACIIFLLGRTDLEYIKGCCELITSKIKQKVTKSFFTEAAANKQQEMMFNLKKNPNSLQTKTVMNILHTIRWPKRKNSNNICVARVWSTRRLDSRLLGGKAGTPTRESNWAGGRNTERAHTCDTASRRVVTRLWEPLHVCDTRQSQQCLQQSRLWYEKLEMAPFPNAKVAKSVVVYLYDKRLCRILKTNKQKGELS